MPAFLPYGRQTIDDDDIAAVVAVLRSDFLTTGPMCERFEEAFARAVGAPHAVAVSSGTSALHLAVLALGLGPGDTAIVPAITFVATANAVALAGAEVHFADVDPDTGLMTAEGFVSALGHAERTKAVLPVDLAGQCPDLPTIKALARIQGVAVLEDACHAVGGEAYGAPVGACAHADITTFSLHPVKTIAAGEGGVMTTASDVIADRVRRLRNHNLERRDFRYADQALDPRGHPNPWYYEVPGPGLNHRLSDIHAALALSQLGKLQTFVARRRALAERYDSLLQPLAPQVRPITRLSEMMPAWHLYGVLIEFDELGLDRALVMRRLRDRGIGTQVHYIPLHRQPYYREHVTPRSLPGAEAYYRRTLSLPLFAHMADTDVDRVAETLADVLGLG